MDWISQLEVIGKVAIAMVLGGSIGFEREIADKPAGFRTHMLVAGTATLLIGLSEPLVQSFRIFSDPGLIRSDPIRIVEAIVTGISFLGAGTIFRRGGEYVEGLTTAASILFCGGIGICVALEQFVLGIGVTVLALLVLRALHVVETKIGGKKIN